MGSQPLRAELSEPTTVALGLRPSACKPSRPVSGRGQGRKPPEAVARSASLEAGRSPVYFQHSCSGGGTARDIDLIWVRREGEYFGKGGLDRANHVDPVQEISLSTQEGLGPVKRRPDGPEIRLPLYSRKRTQVGHRGMTVTCQQRKSAVHTWPLADAVRHRRCFRSMLQPQSRRCSNMQHVGRPKPSEGGGVREVPPHVSYDMLCLSSSQEID